MPWLQPRFDFHSTGVRLPSGQIVKSEQGKRFPLPLHLLSFSLPLASPPSAPSLSIPLPPLKIRHIKSSYGVWGSAVSSPAGSGAEPQPKSNLVHFSLKI